MLNLKHFATLANKRFEKLGNQEVGHMRKAFTMIEIIIVLAIIGLLMFIFAGKFFGAFGKTEMKTTISNDVDSIAVATLDYKVSSPHSTPENTYNSIGALHIAKALTDKMEYTDNDADLATSEPDLDFIGSLGLNGACHYYITADTPQVTGGLADNAFKVLMDCSNAMTNYGWSEKEASRAEDVFHGAWKSRSLSPIAVDPLATDIGAPNAVLTTGGAVDDGIIGIRGIVN